MWDKELVRYKEIYRAALVNSSYAGDKATILKKTKMFIYYLIIVILNSHYKEYEKKVHIINGKAELRLNNYDKYADIYYGFTQKQFKDIIKQHTHIGVLTKRERWKCFFQAINIFLKNNIDGPLIYWIDYWFWVWFMDNTGAEIILSNGHYDRLTTILSMLCKKNEKLFYMKQHGVVGQNQKVPYRISCDKALVFDENEAGKFKKNIIRNRDCEYLIQYDNKVKFINAEKKGILIGIIENPLPAMEHIIRCVTECCGTEIEIVIMLHPLSDAKKYKNFLHFDNVKFTTEKIWNVDLLVSGVSTLAYDYLRKGFSGQILFVDEKNLLPEYRNLYSNLTYIENIEDLSEKINEQI